MITRNLCTSVLALWLFIDHALSHPTTATSSTLTNSASISTLVSPPSSRIFARTLTENGKIGVSIGVTFAAIILVGSTAIFCIIRRRRTALSKPQTRGFGPGEIDDDSVVVGDDLGKGKQAYHMSPPQASHQVLIQQSPNGTVYQAGGYPTIPEQTYAPQHLTTNPGDISPYSGTAYSGLEPLDPSQQVGYAGPSNAQYLSEARLQSRQQAGDNISWRHPSTATSPIDGFPAPDMEERYLQDYAQQEAAYYIPPPRPDTVELPEQRKPLELMGEGHLREIP
ncbi:hypothetical protein FHL15_009116 [Xylaria flabelliformis]|uniref:Mid2 domain-containing protein n=1 Tax=Xylaria flabelliformis TaxID=2512241 RepID=A0A553HPZ2_9PEZI|nr:hypothetical protein FHL15_009116 [Xylaria flabelliformis]